MGRGLRIPSLVNLMRTDDPAVIRALADDKRLDRNFTGSGGLLNRMVVGKVRRVLALDGVALPAVAPRADPERARIQGELQAKLDQAASAGAFDADSLAAIARAVRGYEDAPPLEQAVQQAVGRLFAPDYQASAESWAAAELIDKAAHSMNPLAALWWGITGKIAAAQHVLAQPVHGDRAGVHATGVAVHNLVRGFKLMRTLFAHPNAPDPAAGDSIVARCLKAPESVLREAIADPSPAADAIRPGTLVVLDLGKAQQRDAGPEIVFMAGSWSHCPATAWVPALIRAVWEQALRLPRPQPEPVGGEFRLGFTRAQAAQRLTAYRRLLGVNLVLQAVLGVVMLAAPIWLAHLLTVPAGAPLIRIWGLMLIVLAALYGAGWFQPIYMRWPNAVGIAGRCATALLYLVLGRGFLWLALFDAAFAVALGVTYWQALRAELMSRP